MGRKKYREVSGNRRTYSSIFAIKIPIKLNFFLHEGSSSVTIPFVDAVRILSTATLLSQLALAVVVCIALISLIKGKKEKFIAKVRPLLLLFAFTVSLVATLGSLFYSEVLGFEPCKLCWFQRILMYPQPVLYLVAFLSKKKDVFLFTLPLSIIGVVIASYHYLLQRLLYMNQMPFFYQYQLQFHDHKSIQVYIEHL